MSSHPLCSWIGHDIQRQLSPIQGLVSICQRKKTNHRKQQRKFRVFVFKHPMSRRRRVQWTLRIHRPHQQAPLRFSFPRYFLPQSDYIFFLNSMGNVWSSPSSIYSLKNKILSIIFSSLSSTRFEAENLLLPPNHLNCNIISTQVNIWCCALKYHSFPFSLSFFS